MRIVTDGKSYADHNSIKAVEAFLLQKNRKKSYVERKRSNDRSTNEDFKSNKSKKYQSTKILFQLIIRTITLLTFNFCCVVFLNVFLCQ